MDVGHQSFNFAKLLWTPLLIFCPCLLCGLSAMRGCGIPSLAGQGEHRELGFIALIVAKSQLITDRVGPQGNSAQTETGRRMSGL